MVGGEEDVSVLFTIIAQMFYRSTPLRYTGEKWGISWGNGDEGGAREERAIWLRPTPYVWPGGVGRLNCGWPGGVRPVAGFSKVKLTLCKCVLGDSLLNRLIAPTGCGGHRRGGHRRGGLKPTASVKVR